MDGGRHYSEEQDGQGGGGSHLFATENTPSKAKQSKAKGKGGRFGLVPLPPFCKKDPEKVSHGFVRQPRNVWNQQMVGLKFIVLERHHASKKRSLLLQRLRPELQKSHQRERRVTSVTS